MSESKLNKAGLDLKRDNEAVAEAEKKICEFIEQQYPDGGIGNIAVYRAIKSLHFKLTQCLSV